MTRQAAKRAQIPRQRGKGPKGLLARLLFPQGPVTQDARAAATEVLAGPGVTVCHLVVYSDRRRAPRLITATN